MTIELALQTAALAVSGIALALTIIAAFCMFLLHLDRRALAKSALDSDDADYFFDPRYDAPIPTVAPDALARLTRE